MLYYPNQPVRELFNEQALTSDFGDSRKELTVKGFSKLTLDIDYQRGSGESSSEMSLQIEHSTNGEDWYSLVIDQTGTSSVLTPRVWRVEETGRLNLIVDIAYIKLRVSLKEDDVSSNAGTATVVATISGQ